MEINSLAFERWFLEQFGKRLRDSALRTGEDGQYKNKEIQDCWLRFKERRSKEGPYYCLCTNCLLITAYSQDKHNEVEFCSCGGQFCGCPSCDSFAEAQSEINENPSWYLFAKNYPGILRKAAAAAPMNMKAARDAASSAGAAFPSNLTDDELTKIVLAALGA